MWLLTPDPGQQLYVALFAVTLALHALLIGAVVGGTGYAAIAALRRTPDPIADVVRAWLPIGLGLAITAGVAPLLFVQVLYQDAFYTANLLRGPRWLAIVPALIAGFYLLYVHKRGWGATRVHRAGVLALALGAFGFVAWSWSTNHRLMLDDAAWQLVYAHGEGAWSPVGRAARVADAAAARGDRREAKLRAWLPEIAVGASVGRHDGAWAAGPALRIGVPLFGQGQGARARADAEVVRATLATDALDGRVDFHTIFPAPGTYRVWAEFRPRGEVLLINVDVTVAAAGAATPDAPAAHDHGPHAH